MSDPIYPVVIHSETGAYVGGGFGEGLEVPEGCELVHVEPADKEHLSWDPELRCFVATQHYAVYREESGQLVSWGTEVAQSLPEGLSVKACDPPHWPSGNYHWDPKQLRFTAAP